MKSKSTSDHLKNINKFRLTTKIQISVQQIIKTFTASQTYTVIVIRNIQKLYQ